MENKIWDNETECFKYFHLIIFKLATTFVTRKLVSELLTSVYAQPGE